MSNSLLIIFIKNTIKGTVKTRLAKDLGDDKALEIYEKLLSKTHSVTKNLTVNKEVQYSQYIEEIDLWSPKSYTKNVQKGAALGERMSNAFENGFNQNHQSICIIGSDCYDLSASIIEQAFENLKKYDFVIGPANDGGYYLLGMNKFYPQLFDHKIYSTSSVFIEAIDEMVNLEKKYYVLPELIDIDDIHDLKKIES